MLNLDDPDSTSSSVVELKIQYKINAPHKHGNLVARKHERERDCEDEDTLVYTFVYV